MWQALGCRGDWEPEWARRVAAYMEPHRRYHVLEHITHVLRELDSVRALLERPVEAYWKAVDHDVVYETMRGGMPVTDNELRSAGFNRATLERAGVPDPAIVRIGLGILATKTHAAAHLHRDDQMLVCADLAILGAHDPQYRQYARDVEREWRYSGELSERQYLEGRISLFLEPFLARPLIFPAEPFIHRYEARAKVNLRRELEHQRRRLAALPA